VRDRPRAAQQATAYPRHAGALRACARRPQACYAARRGTEQRGSGLGEASVARRSFGSGCDATHLHSGIRADHSTTSCERGWQVLQALSVSPQRIEAFLDTYAAVCPLSVSRLRREAWRTTTRGSRKSGPSASSACLGWTTLPQASGASSHHATCSRHCARRLWAGPLWRRERYDVSVDTNSQLATPNPDWYDIAVDT